MIEAAQRRRSTCAARYICAQADETRKAIVVALLEKQGCPSQRDSFPRHTLYIE